MRIAISSLAALLITLALFFVMQSMIEGDNQPIAKPRNYGVVDFVRLQQESADTKTESDQHRPPSITAPPRHTLPVISSQLSTSPPVDAPQLEVDLEPLSTLEIGKPYLDPSNVSIPEPMLNPSKASVKKPKISAELPPVEKKLEREIERPQKAIAKTEANIEEATVTPNVTEGINASAIEGDNTTAALTGSVLDHIHENKGDGSEEAIPVFKIEPRYPRKAASRKIEGWVKVEFTITQSGTVTNPVVVESKPRRTFDRSAIQAIRKWRFKPRIVDGKPVQRKASQVIEFRLSKG